MDTCIQQSPASRSFDVDQGQHPVQWVLDNWEPSLIPPLCCWLDGLCAVTTFSPDWSTVTLPAPRMRLNLFCIWGGGSLQVSSLGSQGPQQQRAAKDEASCQTLSLSFLAITLEAPIEGLPVLTDWIRTCSDVWLNGFESWREPIEVRLGPDGKLGEELKPAMLIPTKGRGRASMILFGVLYTYVKLCDTLSDAEQNDFLRRGQPLGTMCRIKWVAL